MGPLSCGPTNHRRGHGDWVSYVAILSCKSQLQECELVRKVVQFGLDIVRLTHCLGFGISLLKKSEQSFTLELLSVRCIRQMWAYSFPPALVPVHRGLPQSTRGQPPSDFGWGVLFVPTHQSSEYPPFLKSLGGVLESTPSVDSLVLLQDFNAHFTDSETLRGVIGRNPKLVGGCQKWGMLSS